MKRIILDTDIGTDVDDAMALSLAALSPELRLEGVTTVHGDAPLRGRIARRILDLAGRPEVPVVPGASIPLQMPLPPNFHWMPKLRGHEGRGILTDKELAPTTDFAATKDDAAHFLIDKATEFPGELSIIAIGSLSNIGRALQLEPDFANRIHDMTIMGGAVDLKRHAWHPMLETNLNCDPLATRLVFDSGIPIKLVPVEVTTQVFLTADHRTMIRDWNPLANALVTLMEEMLEGMASLSEELGLSEDIYQGRTFMHDPLAVYSSMATHLVVTRRTHVAIEFLDNVVRTMVYPERTPNLWVCEQVDAPAFIEFWLGRIRNYAVKTSVNAAAT
jgi:purine nucleosidase